MKARHPFAAAIRRSGTARTRLVVLSLAVCAFALALGVTLAGASKGVQTYFGTQGSGDGEFQTPVGIAVNETGAGAANPGDVYVVDNGNGRIQRFDADGTYLAQFGSPGTAAGQLSGPRGIAVDQQTGDLYVMETEGLRVSKFDAEGNFLLMFGRDVDTGGGTAAEVCAIPANCQVGSGGTAGGEFEFAGSRSGFPSVIPAGAPGAGDVLLADQANHRIQEFTSSGAFVRAFGWDVNAPDGDEAFEECTVAAECLAGDTAENPASGQFEGFGPRRVVADSTGAIYTVEETRVQKFTPQAGPPALNPEGAFAPADLTGQAGVFAISDIQIGAADHVFVVRRIEEGASTCPDGSPSLRESRILELDSSGILLDTHVACARIDDVKGLGLNATTGAMYLSSTEPESRVYLLDDVAPATVTALPATDVTATSATLQGTVNPGGELPGDQTFYRFELSGDGGATWTPLTPKVNDAGTGTADVAVSRPTAGLNPNTEYRYRIFVFKAFGNAPIASAPATFTTEAAAPGVSIATTTASERAAVLRSRVNPNSQATTYRYEYGPTDSYGSTTANLSAGSGAKAVIAAAPISGLQPTSTYHYRVLAANATGTTAGPDRTVVTGEGRAYEQVSPVEKEGSDVVTFGGRTRAASDGNAIQFLSLGSFGGDVRGTGISSEYMAIRSSGGWRTHAITPARQPLPVSELVKAFDPRYAGELSDDLGTGVYVSATPLTDDAPNVAGIKNLYLRRDLRDPGTGTYELLSDAVGKVTQPSGYQPAFADASADFSHVVFTSVLNLTADAPKQGFLCVLGLQCDVRAYEHTVAGVRLVGMVPVAPATSCTGVECVPAKRSLVGGASSSIWYGRGPISDDGSRIVFTVPGPSNAPIGDIYLREGDTTLQLNASERTVPASPEDAIFQAASDDGSKLFFTTTEPLVDADDDNQLDAYRYDLDAPEGSRLTLLSADQELNDPAGGVDAIYGVSADGSYAYFSAGSQLVAGGRPVQPPESLVFSWHDGERAFVGSVLNPDQDGNESWSFALALRLSRVTPDGKRLLFVSSSPNQPTGEQSAAQCNGQPCRRAYVYDAAADGGQGRLQCASCIPDGAPTASDVDYVPRVGTGGAQPEAHLNRALSEDGRYAFFSSADRLVPGDSNGRYDVYAYDTRSAQVSLLSSGQCNCNSYFVDASADGSDVFFTTREQLVGWDVDQTVDLYDARLGGGFPEPASPPPTCQGDACQPPPASLNDPTPASSAFVGAGDRGASRACPKGKRRVRSQGKVRCAPRKAKQQRNRKHRANHDRRASR